MSTLLKSRIEEQNKLWKRMQDIRSAAETDGNRDWTAEERSNWDEAEQRLGVVSRDIERLETEQRLEALDRARPPADPGTGRDDRDGDAAAAERRYAEAFERYMRRGMDALSVEERQLLGERHEEIRAQGNQPDTVGGYLVPDGFRDKLIETMKAFGGIASISDSISTTTGAKLPWPTIDDTGNEGEIVGENQTVTSQDLAFNGRSLYANIFSSKMVKVPLALLQDSAFDFNSKVPGWLGTRIGRRAARAWITGTGVDQPEGITTSIVTGKTGANGQTTSITYNDLIDLEHSVDPAYRLNARYVLGDQALKMIRKLADTQQRPLWVPVPAPGFPATINGWSYSIDNSMPVPAANAKSICFGDFMQGYIIRTVLGVQTMRLTERFADSLQVAFLSWARMDGMIQDPNAIRSYTHSSV